MSLVRIVVLVFGVVYVLVGLLGFLGEPFVTGGSQDAMPSADGDLLGIFPINTLHNVVHLAIGAALLYGASGHAQAVMMARVIGGVYAVVGLLGLVSPDTFGLMPIGGPDILLHLGTAAILLGVTFVNPEPDADVGRA